MGVMRLDERFARCDGSGDLSIIILRASTKDSVNVDPHGRRVNPESAANAAVRVMP